MTGYNLADLITSEMDLQDDANHLRNDSRIKLMVAYIQSVDPDKKLDPVGRENALIRGLYSCSIRPIKVLDAEDGSVAYVVDVKDSKQVGGNAEIGLAALPAFPGVSASLGAHFDQTTTREDQLTHNFSWKMHSEWPPAPAGGYLRILAEDFDRIEAEIAAAEKTAAATAAAAGGTPVKAG